METKDENKYRNYTKCRNQVKNELRKAREIMERDISSDAKQNPKLFWKYVISKRKVKVRVSDFISKTDNSQSITAITDQDKADVLAGLFSSVFTEEPVGEVPILEPRRLNKEFQDSVIEEERVKKELLKLDPNDNEEVGRRRRHLGEKKTSSEIRREKVKMKKNIGLIGGISFVIGSIIGSGIFITPKDVLVETGSVGLCLLVWTFAGILSLLGSLCYCELGCLIPKSGSEYQYLMAGLGKFVAFLFAWTQTFVLTPSAVSICILTFAEYMVVLFDHCGTSKTLVKLIAVITMIFLAIVNCWDTKQAVYLQVFLSAVKLIALSVIIIGGFVWHGRGMTGAMQEGFSGTTNSVSSVALAFYNAFWAYEGWNRLNCVTEELKHPHKNLPRANIFGVTLTIVVYLLANVSYLTVLGTDGLQQSRAVAFTWGEIVLGPAGILMPVAVLFSTIGAANATLFGGSRILYAAAREKQFPEVLSYVSCKRYTPIPSIMLTTILALLFMTFGEIRSLINFFSFAAWLFYTLTVLALVVLRFTMKNSHRPIKIFILFPLIFIVCSMYLVVAPIIQNPTVEFLYAFLFMLGGLILYIPFAHCRTDRGCFESVTRLVQYLMEVVPSPYEPGEL
ncbi:b(0,+)-type amino acid transporter 1-like [Ylistrum balloti]|uniref:b(0,+)-type amino acid transporter 1-like n=1 Tax=Ylistrum balloti TaxID=509963 RepID=UPI002905C432|nr:b(0,+)-type amino acid transporter 1-like [Ylistrum balloti]